VCALAAVTAAVLLGEGQFDSPEEPPPRPITNPSHHGRKGRRSLPPLALPAGYPEEEAKSLLELWTTCSSADDAASAAALRAFLQGPLRTRFRREAAPTLIGMLPSLEVLVLEADEPVPSAAVRLVAVWTLDGGDAARKVLDASGFIERAAVVRAMDGSVDLRVDTARLLGLLGGRSSAERLVILATDASPAVAATAALAIGEIGDRERVLPPDALVGLVKIYDGTTEPAVRRACLETFRRAHRLYAPYDVASREAEALLSPDSATRMQAARNLEAQASTHAFDNLLIALKDPDPRIVEAVAGALSGLLDNRAIDPLRKRRETLEDPAAQQRVDAAIKRLEAL
jgi:hypothetical protein